MNKPVSFELAKLLREKDFKEKTLNSYYKIFTETIFDYRKNEDIEIKGVDCILLSHRPKGSWELAKAPTIAEVVMWLYEKYGIWIKAEPTINDKFEVFVYQLGWKYVSTNNSPTEAYSAAIEYTLKNLI